MMLLPHVRMKEHGQSTLRLKPVYTRQKVAVASLNAVARKLTCAERQRTQTLWRLTHMLTIAYIKTVDSHHFQVACS